MRAASSDNPASSGSTVPSSRFALYPPETPAKAAASPAIGCNPAPRKMMPPSGTSSTYPISLAVFESTPASTITNVSRRFGAESTSSRSAAPIRPLLSMTPMPSIETSTVPSGAKLVKLVTISVRMRCSPAIVARLTG